MDFNKIKILIKRAGLTQAQAAEAIEMSSHGFNQALQNNSMKVRDLEKLCEVLKVSVAEVLDADKLPIGVLREPEGVYKRKRYLEDRMDSIEEEMKKVKKKLGLGDPEQGQI